MTSKEKSRSGRERTGTPDLHDLPPREREVMDCLLALGGGSVHDVMERLVDPPTYDTVRTVLRTLDRKGYVVHHRDGRRFVYLPALSKRQARRQVLDRVVETLFDGSVSTASVALLGMLEGEPPAELLSELRRLVEQRESMEGGSPTGGNATDAE